MRELVGAGVAVVSALLYDVGYVLEKQALDRLPPMKLSPAGVLRVARASRRWVIGFAAMLVGLGLQVGALTLAPVSVVQPILAGGLIALAAAGSLLLGETLNRRHWVALGLVLVAVVAVAASAHNSGRLAHEVPGIRFLFLAIIIAGLAAAAARAGLSGPDRISGRALLAGLVGIALGAGLLYGLGAVSEKAVATRMVRLGVVKGAGSALATPYPWAFAAATVAGMMVFQFGLQNHPASLMASLTNVTSTVCALVGASVVFGEAVLPSSWWSLLRLVGFACVLASVTLLAVDGEPAPGPGGVDRTRPDHAVAP
jgi:drug/metabolite transporter (DMT)-like permease